MNTFVDLYTQIYWRQPLWLLVALFPLALWLWKQYLQQATLRLYADRALHPWIRVKSARDHQRGSLAMQAIIWLLLGIAASGPRLLMTAPDELRPEQGAAILVMDLSRSMHASDVLPDRLRLAHRTLARWSADLPPVKTGIIVFAGESHVVLPPTRDQQAITHAIQIIRELRPPSHGSAVVNALKQSISLLQSQEGSRTIILMTDGDFDAQTWKSLDGLNQELAAHHIEVHIVGIGALSPTTIKDDSGQWLTYGNQTVTTRLNEKALASWARHSDIHYTRLNPDIHQRLSDIWRPRLLRLDTQYENQVLWKELFPWFLLPAILLILAQHVRLPDSVSLASAAAGVATVFMTIIVITGPVVANSQHDLRFAYEAWQQQNYDDAAARYAKIDGYQARMGEGASCFRGGNLECAVNAFSTAAWQADTDEQRGRAAYNLGNSYFRQGNFPAAITLYQDALTYQPDEHRYLNNLEFSEEVQRQIELRLRQEAASLAKRLGPGWRTRAVEPGLELSPDVSVLLDDQPKEDADNGSRTPIPDELMQQYLQRHKNYSLQKGTGEVYRRQHDWSRFGQGNPLAANQIEFWQRLLEIEEGLMVSPDAPLTLPGIRPW
jgi:Ca-activated chloride channel family protein